MAISNTPSGVSTLGGSTPTHTALHDELKVALNVANSWTGDITATNAVAMMRPPAGSVTAGTAPILLTAGPLLTVVEPGAIEYKGHTFYATTYQVRRSIVLAQEIPIVQTVVGTSSAAESAAFYTIQMAADYLTVGKHISCDLHGGFSSVAGPNGVCTIRLKYAGATILTFTTIAGATVSSPFHLEIETICRAIGSGTTGKLKSWAQFSEGSTTINESRVLGALTDIDTTVVNSLTLTAQFAGSSASNGLELEMGHTLCVDANT